MPRTFANNGGCDALVDPALDYDQAGIIWLPQDDTSTVILSDTPNVLLSPDEPDRPALIKHLLPEHGRAARATLAQGHEFQLEFAGDPAQPCVAVIPLDIDGFGRLETVHRLLAALHGRKVPPDTRLTRQQRARARRMLQAFDGARAGATQKDIARVLFRIGWQTRHEWQASAARHAVMSLLRDARAMIAGGYRRLLKHRRQS